MSTDLDVLRVALAGDEVQARAGLGLSLAQATQQAIRLAHDPAVALAYPAETARVRERVDRQRFRRKLHHDELKG